MVKAKRMSKVERHLEALSPDCEEYLSKNCMYSMADHNDDADPADIYTTDGDLVVLQIPRDISVYYLMRLIEHGQAQYAKGLADTKSAMPKMNVVERRMLPSEEGEKAVFALKESNKGTWYSAWVVFFDESCNGPSPVIKFEANVGMCCTFSIESQNDFEQLREAVIEKARDAARGRANPFAESALVSVRDLSRL